MKLLVSLLGLSLAVLFGSISAAAQVCPGSAGCLDTTFGNSGFVSASVNSGVAAGWGNAVAIQSDGKIVVAAESANVENTSAYDCYVLRFDANGVLDPAFGNGGIVRLAFTPDADHEWLQALALQPDGKILLGAKANSTLVGIARLSADGSLDPGFGSSGKVTFNLVSRDYAIPNTIIVQNDGRLAIGLNAHNSGFGFVRLLPDGRFDTTFNGTGKLVVSPAKGNSSTSALIYMAVQPDGKYVASGMLPGGGKGGSGQFGLIRVNANGTLDTTFGSGGKVVTDLGGTWSAARRVAIQADGKIVAGGDWLANSTSVLTSFVFARYLPNGQLDSTFGSGGKTLIGTATSYRRMLGLAIQTDGKIVGSGWDRLSTSSDGNVAILRVNADGTVDAGFGNGGMTLTDYNGMSDTGNDMATQADGRFVVAGAIRGFNAQTSVGLYRYLP
jgi:uncharacterized delta-60 repeat protein